MTDSYIVPTNARFPLGAFFVTASASEAISREDIQAAIYRHSIGHWGEVSNEDWQENERSLADGSRLLSVYSDCKGVKFWVITEADRSATTLLLPDDY